MLKHLYEPGKFSDGCQVLLTRYPCPYGPEEHPHRVQLSRRKGWRKPPNTVVVARPSKWGNPFVVGLHAADREQAVQWFANWLTNSVDADGRFIVGGPDYHRVPAEGRPSLADIRAALAGKNLACWCPLGEPCHADVLLNIANEARHG